MEAVSPARNAAVLVIAAALAASLAAAAGAGAPPVHGVTLDRTLPSVPLLDARGRSVTLSAFRGRIVVLTPVLTLCHEVCPLTTGALVVLKQAVRRAGLGRDVVFAEISVDPWRDSPARLRAFSRRTGTHFTLLTGTERNLRRFWHPFGVAFLRTPEDSPPDRDWWTHRPLTFDVAHTDGLFFLDRRGHLRIALIGMPGVRSLPPKLRSLLNGTGRRNLVHPEAPWTAHQALDDLGVLLGRRIPE
jgi:protein SCO1/2